MHCCNPTVKKSRLAQLASGNAAGAKATEVAGGYRGVLVFYATKLDDERRGNQRFGTDGSVDAVRDCMIP
jgi:hypothetical protein